MATSRPVPVRVALAALVPVVRVVRGRAALAQLAVADTKAAVNAARALAAMPIVARDAKVDSSNVVRAGPVALVARDKDRARPVPTDIRAMRRASRPTTPTRAVSTRTATSRARHDRPVLVRAPAVVPARRDRVAHHDQTAHVRVVRVAADAPEADEGHKAAIADRD